MRSLSFFAALLFLTASCSTPPGSPPSSAGVTKVVAEARGIT